MPIECEQLLFKHPLSVDCPKCGKTGPLFLRGMIQSGWRKLFGLPYCAMICCHCKEIIGREKP